MNYPTSSFAGLPIKSGLKNFFRAIPSSRILVLEKRNNSTFSKITN
jgi:hypothetical protein